MQQSLNKQVFRPARENKNTKGAIHFPLPPQTSTKNVATVTPGDVPLSQRSHHHSSVCFPNHKLRTKTKKNSVGGRKVGSGEGSQIRCSISLVVGGRSQTASANTIVQVAAATKHAPEVAAAVRTLQKERHGWRSGGRQLVLCFPTKRSCRSLSTSERSMVSSVRSWRFSCSR